MLGDQSSARLIVSWQFAAETTLVDWLVVMCAVLNLVHSNAAINMVAEYYERLKAEVVKSMIANGSRV